MPSDLERPSGPLGDAVGPLPHVLKRDLRTPSLRNLRTSRHISILDDVRPKLPNGLEARVRAINMKYYSLTCFPSFSTNLVPT